MAKKEAKRVLKNVIINLKLKRGFEEKPEFFSHFQLLPKDVYNDADENNMQVETVSTQPVIKKKKKFNKQLLSWLFILLNIVVVAVIFITQSLEGGIKPISELFAEAPYYRFLFLGLGIMCVILLIEAVKFIFIIKSNTGKWRPLISLNVAVIGRYWDCITPFGSGGQPFQIYYLSKHGYKADNATSIPLTKYLFWQISFCIISIIVLITPIKIAYVGSLIKYLAWLGIIGNLLLFSFMLLMSLNRKLGGKILNGVLKLLNKLKIIKNYDKAYNKAHETFDNYQKCIKSNLKNPLKFLLQLFFGILNILLNASIAYCIYLAFNYAYILDGTVVPTSIVEIIALSILCDAASSLIPLPGGSGAAELSFIGLFGLMFKADMQFWAMLFWRMFTYYGIIIIGLIFTICNSVVSNRRLRKLNKLQVLEQVVNE